MLSFALAVEMNIDEGRSTMLVLSSFPQSAPGGLDNMSEAM